MTNKSLFQKDVNSLYNIIDKNTTKDDYIQIIVFYSRTNVIPKVPTTKRKRREKETMDVIFMHDGTDNVQNVYDVWNELDENGSGWYYETSNFMAQDKISKALMELISHPLQRPKNQESIFE